MDDFRVRPDQLEGRMEQYVVGDRVSLLVARRDRLIRLEVDTRSRTAEGVATRGRSVGATPAQLVMLDFWLAQSGISGHTG